MSSVKYKDAVFLNTSVDKNLVYFDTLSNRSKKKFYSFDLYQPQQDPSSSLRPLIIWMHGGGFKFGSKSSKAIRVLCNSFAQKGYVCASINYRLSKKNTLTNVKALLHGCYEAVQDVDRAVMFFKLNFAKYRIDTNRIILGGNSAGAIVALQAVYSSSGDLLSMANGSDRSPDTGVYNGQHVAAVINFWGSVFKISWLKNGNTPIVSVHGRNDHIVPIGKNKSSFYGSLSIQQQADQLHIPNRLKIYEGYAHELQKHFNPLFVSAATRRRWLEGGQFATDFLYEELFRHTKSIANTGSALTPVVRSEER